MRQQASLYRVKTGPQLSKSGFLLHLLKRSKMTTVDSSPIVFFLLISIGIACIFYLFCISGSFFVLLLILSHFFCICYFLCSCLCSFFPSQFCVLLLPFPSRFGVLCLRTSFICILFLFSTTCLSLIFFPLSPLLFISLLFFV